MTVDGRPRIEKQLVITSRDGDECVYDCCDYNVLFCLVFLA